MRLMTLICIMLIAILHCSCSKGQDDSPSVQPTVAPNNEATAEEVQEQIEALLGETQRLVGAGELGNVFLIGWRTNGDGTVAEIMLLPDDPQPERTVEDYDGLKAEITRLPEGSSVSYVFSDFRPDLLSLNQILELRDLCKENEMNFYLHAGG